MGRGDNAEGVIDLPRTRMQIHADAMHTHLLSQGPQLQPPFLIDQLSEQRQQSLAEALAAIVAVGDSDPLPDAPKLSSGTQPLPESVPRLLGLTGEAQSGKDVCTEKLAAQYANIERMAFSDDIMREMNQLLQPLGAKISESNKAEPHNRLGAQEWALAKIELNNSYWSDLMRQRIQTAQQQGRTVLLTGVRTHQDVQMIKECGGDLWKVVRPANPYKADHPIEQQIRELPADVEILNDVEGDIQPLYDNLHKAIHA